ncbi:MAG: fused response regulator/phosphatase [Verrucomicrobiae bacterium]|nr:fused response regulator/phosphatase [Verrucomicrobiae bacterium]NNJ43936.1 fused response regulator/phosphatase [Akkermansiaceae bacterium]
MSTPTKLRVLSLEDSVIDFELILRVLQEGGLLFESTRVDNRDDYVSAIHEFHPDLILADYRLPTFDGALALEIAKDHCPNVPLIVISGAVGEETAVELIKNGATDFVIKDHLGRLVPAVRRALQEVESRNARRKAEADLRSLNEELEYRVQKRTQELREKNTVMEEDLEMARELQMAFLPTHFPTIPRGVSEAASAVKFASVFYPSSSVSGDFYNIVRISESTVGIFICDVMGHGVRAALVTAIMRALEEQLGEESGDPGPLLTQLNSQLRVILQQFDTTMFATACYITVDIASGRLTFANAGHPYPLLIRSATGNVEVIGSGKKHGPALGLIDDVPYHTHELTVDVGDRILLFTDGLFEVENEEEQAFSEDRLRDVIQQRASLPLGKLLQDTSHEIKDFAQDHVFTDDVCLVGVEISRMEARVEVAQ